MLAIGKTSKVGLTMGDVWRGDSVVAKLAGLTPNYSFAGKLSIISYTSSHVNMFSVTQPMTMASGRDSLPDQSWVVRLLLLHLSDIGAREVIGVYLATNAHHAMVVVTGQRSPQAV